jgi:1,2-diacylglycerol 3-beta-galactosyltransferase
MEETMNPSTSSGHRQRARRLLIIFSDTGGGHRSAASAVAEALQDLYGEVVQIAFVDPLAEYAPWPLDRLGSIYTYLVRLKGKPWAIVWHLSNGQRRVMVLTKGWWLLVRTMFLKLLRDHPADAVVCCHPLFNAPILRGLNNVNAHTPLITLMTDLIAAHPFWFEPGVSCYLVPTKGAHRRALACGLPAERVQVTGLPVNPRFVAAAREDPLAVRRRLGLEPDLPVVLLVGGAEGMGPFHRLCRTVAASGAQAQLVMIAGRNERLRARLAATTWSLPVQVTGFVQNMHEWMRAADLLVTKAGPSTISEALVMGLPIVLSGALPGQEQPNVDYVVQAGAGVWAPTPRRAAVAVRDLLSSDNPSLDQMAARAQALGQPGAARRVAEIVWAVVNEESTQ